MIWDALLLTAAGGGSQTTPTLPGGIIAWIICNAQKRHAVGGWLLFYYWQVYGTLVLSAVFFGLNIQSYVPENFENKTRFALFLAAAVPGLLLILIQTVVATFSIGVQTPDMLKVLRVVLAAQVLAGIIEVAIDSMNFPDNLFLSIYTLLQESLWLAYFFRSKRVRHVFGLQDWDIAVNSIYPPKLKAAT